MRNGISSSSVVGFPAYGYPKGNQTADRSQNRVSDSVSCRHELVYYIVSFTAERLEPCEQKIVKLVPRSALLDRSDCYKNDEQAISDHGLLGHTAEYIFRGPETTAGPP